MQTLSTPAPRPARAKTGVLAAPPEPVERLGLAAALLSISKSIRAMHGLKLGEVGFANGQDELLIALDSEGIAVNEMADLLMVRPSTVSKMLDRLVAKGLIERVPDERDGRRTTIRITPAGVAARRVVMKARTELGEDLCRPLDGESADLFQASLNDCAERLAKRLRRLR